MTTSMKFQFDRFTLDTKTFEFSSENNIIELEPKLFNILKLLVTHTGQVITKEQLLDEIWNNRVVTDNAISRAIYELRKVLDKADSKKSLIKTVRGRGFQINCDVITVEPKEKNQTIKSKTNQTWLFFIPIMILALTLGYWLFNQQRTQNDVTKTISQSPTSLVILPLQTSGTDSKLINLSHVIVDSLSNQLQSTLNIRVIHPDSLVGSEEMKQDLISIQDLTKASLILEGYITTPTDETLKLNLTLHRLVGNHVLEPFDLGGFLFPWPDTDANLEKLHKQRKTTAKEIAKLIKPESTLNLDQNQTSNPTAYRLVIAAHHAIRENNCSDINRAESLLKKAIEQDPEYANAWFKLMVVYIKNIWICGGSADNYELALHAADQVEKLAPNRFHAIHTARNAILLENNQVEKAFEFIKDVNPKDPVSLYNKAADFRYAGFLKAGLQLENQILQLDPYFYNAKPISKAPYTHLYLNMFDEHLTLLAEPGNSYHDYFRALNLYMTGQIAPAKSILKNVSDRNNKGLFDQFSKSLLFTLEQKPQASIDVLDQIIKQRSLQGHSDGEMTYKLAQLYAIANESEQALIQLELSLNQGFFPFQYWQRDPALTSIRDLAKFKQLVEKAKQRHLAFAEKFGLEAEI